MNPVGQLMMFGIEGFEMTNQTEALIKDTGCGGIILFSRNIKDPMQVRKLIDDLNFAAGYQLIIGVDQEGGRVARLKKPFTELLPMANLGQKNDGQLAKEVGALLAKELAAVGFNIDFAPVVDVATNPLNPVIGDRAISSDAEVTARLGIEFIHGMQEFGVAACAKHFPGHGDTDVDSHHDLPVIKHDRVRIDKVELHPFREAIKANVASIMVAHLLVPSLDERNMATVSRKIVTDLLRNELKYDGLVITDDLVMKGITNSLAPEESVWRCIDAGCDIALICHKEENQRRAYLKLKKAIDKKKINPEQVARSLARIAGFKSQYCQKGKKRPSMDIIGCQRHLDIAARLG